MNEEIKKIIEKLEERIILHNIIKEPISSDLDKAIKLSVAYEDLLEENQKLKEQLQQKEDIINKITNYCKFQIEKEQDKFPKPLESEKWLKGRISAFEEILDNKGEK